MTDIRAMISGDEAIVAPAALNPLMALLAQAAGFRALYLSGGSLGWLNGITEANLNLTDMAHAGIEIRSVCKLPLIFDAAGGYGDPMHMHRTIAMAERAGFGAIEIEDQLLPKRAHHHIGNEQVIPQAMMEAKIREACAARTDDRFVIIARTDAVHTDGLDEALRRAEAYRRAGADMLFVHTRSAEETQIVGSRLGAPLMIFTPRDGTGALKISLGELGKLGFRIVGIPILPLLSMHRALKQTYAALANGQLDPAFGPGGAEAEMKDVYRSVDLERLLEIERRTVDV